MSRDLGERAVHSHLRLLSLLLPPLLGKHLPAHLQHHLEPFATLGRVLREALDRGGLDAVLDLLPSAAQRRDLRVLLELRARVRLGLVGLVHDRLAHRDQLRPRHVHRAHGDLLRLGVDVRRLEHERRVLVAEEAVEPRRRRLLAGDETLGAELVRLLIDDFYAKLVG
jgi:hypothetical protein